MRTVSALLLLAVFLSGIAHIAFLPPFEGYDETAHWSYIQQLSDTGRIPVYGVDRLSADVDAYPGPRAAPSGQPYRDFRAATIEVAPTQFAPGAEYNWQAQHPPLFYAIMVAPYRLLAGLPWRWHLFGLRLASWAIAFAGFAWGGLTTQRLLRRTGADDIRALVPLAWPFIFAEFFPELARLTNDALCMLLLAWAWWLLLRWQERGGTWPRAAMLGVVLGAGLLTKAFFLAITVGVVALLALNAWRGSNRRLWRMVAGVAVLATVIGGSWYVGKWRDTGDLTGSANFIELQAQGGLLHGLLEHFSVIEYARGIGGIISSFCWAGTWSFALPNRLFLVPVAALVVVPGIVYVARLRFREAADWVPLFIVAPVVAGLLYHLLATIAVTGVGNETPGWYLHIFAAPLSLILVRGGLGSRLMAALIGYAFVLTAALAWLQLGFFSGCLPRVGFDKVFWWRADCVVDLAQLNELAVPTIGFPILAAALLTLLLAAVVAARQPGSS